MYLNIANFLKSSLPCLLFLGLAWFAHPYQANIPIEWSGITHVAPALTFLLAALLGFHFNRNSLALACLASCLYWLGVELSHDGQPVQFDENIRFLAFTWLYIALAVFGFSKDQHILSPPALTRLGFLAVIAFFLYFTPQHGFDVLSAINKLLPWSGSEDSQYQNFIYQYAIQLALISALAIALFIRALLTGNTLHSNTFYALPAILFATLIPGSTLSHALFTCVGLMCGLAVLLDSYNLAYRDELTGLPSRRALNHDLESLGRNYTIAMLDIDHFKKFNDTHGHDIGDQVLKMVAGRIAKTGGNAKVYRYGGEEFTVLFPRKDREYALPHLEALRESIEKYKMGVRSQARTKQSNKKQKQKRQTGNKKGKSLSVTISIGMAERDEQNQTTTEVIKAADQALYKAKKKGRNCVV